jgi:hypothetical protein
MSIGGLESAFEPARLLAVKVIRNKVVKTGVSGEREDWR